MPSRHRERLLSHAVGTAVSSEYNSSNVLVNEEEVEVVLDHAEEIMDDVVTPDFHKRISAGEVIINPVNYLKESLKVVGSGRNEWLRTNGQRYVRQGPGVNQLLDHDLIGAPFKGAPELPDVDVELRSVRLQALGHLDRSPYAFGEDIGELRETFNFLRAPFRTLDDASRLFSRDVNRQMRRSNLERAKAVAAVWAEYQFAFLPLVRSVSDLIESFSDQIHLPSRRTARGFSQSGTLTESDVIDEPGKTENQKRTVWSRSTSVNRDIRAGIMYEDSSPFSGWREKYGLRFKDIPRTAWELFPYSFMVDRMFNISQSLGGLTSFLDPSIKILGAWETVRLHTIASRSCIGNVGPIVQTDLTTNPETDVKETFSFTRREWQPSITDLFPPLRIEGLVDTSTKLADLAALILLRIRH